jgi:hypothetical protein
MHPKPKTNATNLNLHVAEFKKASDLRLVAKGGCSILNIAMQQKPTNYATNLNMVVTKHERVCHSSL